MKEKVLDKERPALHPFLFGLYMKQKKRIISLKSLNESLRNQRVK